MITFLTFLFLLQIKNELIWDISPFPPYILSNDEEKREGLTAPIQFALKDELSKHFKLDDRELPTSRAITFLKDKRDICSVDWKMVEERKSFADYSPFYGLSMNVMAIAQKSLFKDEKSLNSINLKKIIAENRILIGLRQDNSYGPTIDKLIKEGMQKNPSSFFKRPGVNASDALYKMLQSNRIQLYLGHVEEYSWMLKTTQLVKKIDVVAYPIDEVSIPYTKTYIICSKSDIGKQAMKIITKTMFSAEFKRKEKMLKNIKLWLSEKDAQRYESYIIEALNQEKQ